MLKVQTLSNRVYHHLLPKILTGELAPGDSLREVSLSQQLGVSRTPIREALHRLAEYGVVQLRPNHGAVVRRLGRQELIYLYQIREALEGLAAELACGHLKAEDFKTLTRMSRAARDKDAPDYLEAFDKFDIGLHNLVAERSGNPLLAQEVAKLQGLTMLIHDQLESVLIDRKQIPGDEKIELRVMCWQQHNEIISSLRNGNPEECRRTMVEHLRATCSYKIRLFPE